MSFEKLLIALTFIFSPLAFSADPTTSPFYPEAEWIEEGSQCGKQLQLVQLLDSQGRAAYIALWSWLEPQGSHPFQSTKFFSHSLLDKDSDRISLSAYNGTMELELGKTVRVKITAGDKVSRFELARRSPKSLPAELQLHSRSGAVRTVPFPSSGSPTRMNVGPSVNILSRPGCDELWHFGIFITESVPGFHQIHGYAAIESDGSFVRRPQVSTSSYLDWIHLPYSDADKVAEGSLVSLELFYATDHLANLFVRGIAPLSMDHIRYNKRDKGRVLTYEHLGLDADSSCAQILTTK